MNNELLTNAQKKILEWAKKKKVVIRDLNYGYSVTRQALARAERLDATPRNKAKNE